jgi:DNA-binding winged helix-turn-helix (wHTH) protein/Tfp pilus assembly protein PilF
MYRCITLKIMVLTPKTGAAAISKKLELELDLGRYELRRGGRRIKLEKKPMELLIFLVRHREQLVSREEIVAKLWHSDSVIDVERNINNIVRKIRTALGDDAEKPRFLETVIGKGYRFVGPVRVISPPRSDSDLSEKTRERPSLSAKSRYSRDPLAYGEFMQGHRLSSSGDPRLLEDAARYLTNAVNRDPEFALAHATLAFVYAARHFEFDPSRTWLERAEFHCDRALELDKSLPEAHVTRAYLLWGPSKNFQHVEAIAELKCALALDKNLPHAYGRLGTILAHIGLLDHARAVYERGRAFDPKNAISHSVAQVYLWSGEYELAQEEVERWQAENLSSKYASYFALEIAILAKQWEQAAKRLEEARGLMPDEPLIISLEGVMHALQGRSELSLDCINRACTNPKSFGHAHHAYYQIACILSVLGNTEAAFEWLERSVDTGFACWPFFVKDPCLESLRSKPRFELLVSSLQSKYPESLGVIRD